MIEKTVGQHGSIMKDDTLNLLNLISTAREGDKSYVMFLKGTSYHGLRDVENALELSKAVQLQKDLPGAWKNMLTIQRRIE